MRYSQRYSQLVLACVVALTAAAGVVSAAPAPALSRAAPVALDESLGRSVSAELTPDAGRAVYLASTVAGLELRSVAVDGGDPIVLADNIAGLLTVPTFPGRTEDPRLTTERAEFAVTADSATVVYTGDPGDGRTHLFAVSTTGGSPRDLTPDLGASATVTEWEITPDGERVVFIADTDVDELYEVRVVPVAGGTVSGTGAPLAGAADAVDLAVSPDGSRVIYEVTGPNPGVVSAPLPPTGSDVVSLTPSVALDADLTIGPFTPDGARMLVSYEASADAHTVVSVPVDGGTAVLMTSFVGDTVGLAFETWAFDPTGTIATFSRLADTTATAQWLRTDGTFGPETLLDPGPGRFQLARPLAADQVLVQTDAIADPGLLHLATLDGMTAPEELLSAADADGIALSVADVTDRGEVIVLVQKIDGIAIWQVPIGGEPFVMFDEADALFGRVRVFDDIRRVVFEVEEGSSGVQSLRSMSLDGNGSVAIDQRGATQAFLVDVVDSERVLFVDLVDPVTRGLFISALAPRCAGLLATVIGTAGDDELAGTTRADVIVTGAGADTVRGRGGADVICTGPGADQIDSGAGADVVRGGGGDDDMAGRRGADELRGGAGGDDLRGGRGTDTCRGGRGRDIAAGCETTAGVP